MSRSKFFEYTYLLFFLMVGLIFILPMSAMFLQNHISDKAMVAIISVYFTIAMSFAFVKCIEILHKKFPDKPHI